MTLGPVILAAAIYSGGRVVETFQNAPGASWLLVPLGWASPLVIGVIVLSAVYKLLPNTRVKYRAAVGGAVVALPLWLLARWAFESYIDEFVTRGNLYGVLGVLPLFLIWLNLSWLIFLFGAQLAHTAADLNRIQLATEAERIVLGPSDVLAAVLAVAQRFQDGRGAASLDHLAETLTLPGVSVEGLMDRLAEAGVVCAVEGRREPQFALALPPGKIDVVRVLALGDPRAVDYGAGHNVAIARAVDSVRKSAQSALTKRTLADLLD
jgi:membrane protein